MPTAMLVGSFPAGRGVLEESYARAFSAIGWRVVRFDYPSTMTRHHRLARIWKRGARLVPDHHAVHLANRDIVTTTLSECPDLLIVIGECQVRPGSMAQLSASSPTRRVLVWPDTLVNLSDETTMTLPLYDLVACYGEASCEAFRRLGARHVEWVPLAADPALHCTMTNASVDQRWDVTFIGNWRAERDEALTAVGRIDGIALRICGGASWKQRSGSNPVIMRAWSGSEVYGDAFERVVRESRINLNIIDPTNFPSANMRSFEIPCAGGLQLSSACPELQTQLPHGEACFYYGNTHELQQLVRELLANKELRRRVAEEGRRRVMEGHTYEHRARRIVELVSNG